MLECLLIGDSIAVGTHHFRPECTMVAHSGWSSEKWTSQYISSNLSAKSVIISLGSNDTHQTFTKRSLTNLRDTIKKKHKVDRVIWILPAIKPKIQEVVRKIAEQNGDMVIPITKLSKDGVHPTYDGYRTLALQTK